MAMNDRMKGPYYRAPVSKLASRSSVLNQLNKLIDYFGSLNELLSKSFNRITNDRNYAIEMFDRMETAILHFNFIVSNYRDEVDVHIAERLSAIIDSFTSTFDLLVEKYNTNPFNHVFVSDEAGSSNTKTKETDLAEWDKSVNMLSTDLGIRWFGGKFDDLYVVNELKNVFRIVKSHTYNDKVNEDVINSNLVLEIFVRTAKGMSWLVLGQNGALGYNLVCKYQSKTLVNDIKVVSESYNIPKEYDINQFDMNVYVKTLLEANDVGKKNVYIKVKTNIPSNTESGREGYYVSTNEEGRMVFDEYREMRSIINATKKMLYDDNTDVKIIKRDGMSLEDVMDVVPPIEVETENIVSARITREHDTNAMIDSKTNSFSGEIKTKFGRDGNVTFNNDTLNSKSEKMNTMMDVIDGRVTNHSDVVNTSDEYYHPELFDNTNKECPEGAKAKYFDGDQIEDVFDYRNIGKIALVAKNENMFEVDGNIGEANPIVQNDQTYGEGNGDNTVYNKLYNNSLFDSVGSDDYVEKKFKILFQENNIKINCLYESTSKGVLLGTNKGVYSMNTGRFYSPVVNVSCIKEFENDLYIGTIGSGIYKYVDETVGFRVTNITGENFTSFVVAPKADGSQGSSLYAINSNCFYMDDVDGKYRLNKFCYCLTPTGWMDESDYSANVLGNIPDTYELTSEKLAKGMTDKNADATQEYKIYYVDGLKKWFILNTNTGYVACTENNLFKKFQPSEISETYKTVVDILYENQKFYIAVKERDEVYNYDGTRYQKVEYMNYGVKNGRRTIEKALCLTNVNSISQGVE